MSTVQVTLGDICTDGGIQTGPFGSQLHQSDYSREGIPVIMPVNLVDGAIDARNIARIETHHVERLSKYVVHSGDIVYARRGDVGRCARVTKNEDGWLCGTGCLRLTTNGTHVDKDYVYYCLTQPSVVGWVQNHAVGATMPNLNTTILKSVPLVIEASIINQEHIANILSAYDKLTENNRKQIKLLEEAAQRLYKEWFIDLKFPGHESTPIDPTTNLPEEWDSGCLGDLALVVTGKTPSTINADYYGEAIPFVKIPDMRDHIYPLKTESSLSERGAFSQKGKTIPPNSILLSCIGTVGETCITYMQCQTNQQINALIPNEQEHSYYLYCLSSRLKPTLEAIGSNGATMTNVNKGKIQSIGICIPSKELFSEYCKRTQPLFEVILRKERQIIVTQEARDRLLPKLMSGEIEV